MHGQFCMCTGVWNTLLSDKFASAGNVPLEGYELLKGLSGVATHEHAEYVPIIENTQNYASLAEKFRRVLQRECLMRTGFC